MACPQRKLLTLSGDSGTVWGTELNLTDMLLSDDSQKTWWESLACLLEVTYSVINHHCGWALGLDDLQGLDQGVLNLDRRADNAAQICTNGLLEKGDHLCCWAIAGQGTWEETPAGCRTSDSGDAMAILVLLWKSGAAL